MPAPAGPLAGVIPPGFAGRANLTIPLATLLGLADRPGEMTGIGPLDPDLARDLAAAAARTARSTWCVTVTDQDGHAIGHGCARPAPARSQANPPKRRKPGTAGGPDPPPGGPSFTFNPTGQPGPPGGYGTWRLATGTPGQRDLLIALEPIPTGECDHRHEAKGHDPGVLLRHLTQIRHATCTGPGCRRPATSCDFEHNTPYEAGGRTCLCNGNPKCRHDHRLKQDPRWNAEQLPTGHIRWTTPSRTAIPHRTHPLPHLASWPARAAGGVFYGLGDAPSEDPQMAEMAAEETSETDSDKQRTPLTMIVPPAVLVVAAIVIGLIPGLVSVVQAAAVRFEDQAGLRGPVLAPAAPAAPRLRTRRRADQAHSAVPERSGE